MRTVAILLALLALPAVMPTVLGTTDQCQTALTSARACVRVDVPAVAERTQPATYFVYVGDSSCLSSPTGTACRGENSLAYGVVYQNTNGVEGLQRQGGVVNGRAFAADRNLLL